MPTANREPGDISEDGKLSWIEVECLGACVNAPMVQINDDFYEDLTADTFERLLEDLRHGRDVMAGPQTAASICTRRWPNCVERRYVMLRDEDRIFTNIYGFTVLIWQRRRRGRLGQYS